MVNKLVPATSIYIIYISIMAGLLFHLEIQSNHQFEIAYYYDKQKNTAIKQRFHMCSHWFLLLKVAIWNGSVHSYICR